MSSVKQEVSELSIPVPWGEIRGKAWGPEHGHPVLCLHGWADNCGSFNTLIPFLPKECRYVAVDMPGHGLSSHRPPGVFYSFPEYAADVRRVTESLSWTKFSIMGHSMGGNIAVMFSALYPDMVDGIIVLDVFGFVPTDPKEIPRIMRQGMDEMLKYEKKAEEEKKRVYTYEKAVERLLAANPTLSERSVQMLLERGLTRVEGGFVFSRDLRVNFKNIERITLEQSLAMQSMIQAPVLLILADKGFGPASRESSQKLTSKLLQVYQERNIDDLCKVYYASCPMEAGIDSSSSTTSIEPQEATRDGQKKRMWLLRCWTKTPEHKDTVVRVPGSHHVHLDNPEVVAPFICDFLQTKVLSQQVKA